MKKYVSLLLAVLLLLTTLPLGIVSVSAANGDFAGGGGTESDPYLIATKAHLDNVRFYLSAHFRMIDDIVFTESDFDVDGPYYNDSDCWEPIGTKSAPFTGVFDGGDYGIYNLKVDTIADYAGLFGYLSNGSLRNIRLYNADIYGGDYVGGICGYLYTKFSTYTEEKNALVSAQNCYVDGKIQADAYAGGITGFLEGVSYSAGISGNYAYAKTQVIACYNNATVTAENYAGGIAGSTKSAGCHIVQCINAGAVTADGIAGGITAYLSGDDSNTWSRTGLGSGLGYGDVHYYYSYEYARVENCINKGDVSGDRYTSNSVGGLVARAEATDKNSASSYNSGISGGCINSYNIGTVTGSGEPIISLVKFCPYATCYSLATEGEEGLSNKRTFTDWDFDTVWTMAGDVNYLYPELRCFTLQGTTTIEGAVTVGQTLSASFVSSGTKPVSLSFEWYVDNVLVGTGGTYTVTAADEGKELKVRAVSGDVLCAGHVASALHTVVPACRHEYDDACDYDCSLCGEVRNAPHNILHIVAKDVSCYEDGNIEYWYCADCGQAWLDEARTLNTNLKAVVLPMGHGAIVHEAAKDATCIENGNLEYWYCEACGQAWLDEACTMNTNLKAVVLPALGHNSVSHIAAKNSTCVENGNIEYWTCADCGKAWLNKACTLPISPKAVFLPLEDHAYDNIYDVDCNGCGAVRDTAQPSPVTFGGNSVSEDVMGLAFRFDAAIEGIAVVNGNIAVYDNATVGDYKVVAMGAVLSNNGSALTLHNVNGVNVLDIKAERLFDYSADSACFAVRITNIPAAYWDTVITARAYLMIEDADGNRSVVYGDVQSATYNEFL